MNEKDGIMMENECLKEYGIVEKDGIQIVTIIGEIEGHDCLTQSAKTTKYEHLLPILAESELREEVRGILFLMNTVGGDVSCGLALAEMIAGLSKPTVSLIIGDSHSIGVPLAVSTDYTYIAPSATMVIHPVRMSGTVLGTRQTFHQFQQIQDRIIRFIAMHSQTSEEQLEKLMMNTSMMAKDLGTVLVGKEAVYQGLIKEEGNIASALVKIRELIQNKDL